MQLIYLSPVSWVSFAQRPHKFVEWFRNKTGGNVLWIDPYPTRFPKLSDFCQVGARVTQSLQHTPSWLTLLQPLALPIEPLPGSKFLNNFAWRSTLEKIDGFASVAPTLVVVGKPSLLAIEIVRRLRDCRSIYDAMDDFPAFYTGLSRLAMQRHERELVQIVTGVLASSTLLRERWSEYKQNVMLVHNGLDPAALPQVKACTSSKEKSVWVWGYVGTLAAWFDWDWVIELAKSRPSDVIRLIGPVFSSLPDNLPGNLELFPPCDHRAALSAMQDFDVGLIPFKKNDLTASVDPIKYYEYRAFGLPVVSTNFGEMAFRTGEEGTFLSYQLKDISSVAQKAIRHLNSDNQRVRFVEQNSWEERFDHAGILQ